MTRTCAHCGCNLRREKEWPDRLCSPCEKTERDSARELTPAIGELTGPGEA